MTQPPDESQRNPSESPFMGPAVPPRSGASGEPDDLSEPLAPFFGGGREPDEGDAGDDEIPWLVGHEEPGDETDTPFAPLEEPSYLGGVPEVDIDEVEPDLVSFEALEPDAETEVAPPAPAATQPTASAGQDVDDWESALAALPQPAAGPPPTPAPAPAPAPAAGTPPHPAGGARELHVEQAGGFREAGSAIAHDVADRLERIAHSLRVRGPNDLLAGAGDPLEILIIGYVLGASHGHGETGGDQAPTL